jgi:hypothetical protein
LTITQDENVDGDYLYIYLIKYGKIPHFDFLNNPAICCSSEGGVICDMNYEKEMNLTKDSKLLKNHSLYYKDIALISKTSQTNLEDNKTFETEGIFYLIFLACSPSKLKIDNTSFLKISGFFSFFNSFGYLSADEFYTVDIYLFLSLFYFIISLYWVYTLIVNNNRFNFYTKIISIILPVVILEKMMNLQIYSELNRVGELNSTFEWIFIICNAIKNILLRIFFFIAAMGYKFNLNFYEQIPKKKTFNFYWIMVLYSISLILYLIIDKSYTFRYNNIYILAIFP